MSGEYRKSLTPALTMLLVLSFCCAPSMSQQSVQRNETDLDFTSRLVSETDRMQMQVRELSARVSALEEPVVSSSQAQMATQQQVATTSSNSTGTPERLRHKDRAVSVEDIEQIKAQLGTLDYKVVQEQQRLNAVESTDADQQTASVNSLRRLADDLQRLEESVAVMERASR